MDKIKLIPVLYFCKTQAGYSKDDLKLDIGQCIMNYNNQGADAVLLIDLSKEEKDHDASIGTIKQLAREVELPIYVGGNIHRLEDVKKYIYAGAKRVYCNLLKEEEMTVFKEAVERFGEDHVCSMDYGSKFALLDANLTMATEDVYGFASLETDFYAIKQKLRANGIPVFTYESEIEWSAFRLNRDGLIPVIVQDYRTNEVLMMAYMDEAAFHETINGGRMCYYSRSRQSRWLKGETSGHYQYVKSLHLDCDNDTMLAKVVQVEAACHTGAVSCFHKPLFVKEGSFKNPHKVFEDVYGVIEDRKLHPKEGSYTNYLFDKGIDKILKKCGEEATEIVIAAKNPDSEEIKYEISDFLYHLMVLMVEKGVTWEDITNELANR